MSVDLLLPIAVLSQYLFGPVIFILSLFIILLILVQRGKGGGLTGALGGPGGHSAFGTKAGDLFTRITVIAASIWIFLLAFTVWWYTEDDFTSPLANAEGAGVIEAPATPGSATLPTAPPPMTQPPVDDAAKATAEVDAKAFADEAAKGEAKAAKPDDAQPEASKSEPDDVKKSGAEPSAAEEKSSTQPDASAAKKEEPSSKSDESTSKKEEPASPSQEPKEKSPEAGDLKLSDEPTEPAEAPKGDADTKPND